MQRKEFEAMLKYGKSDNCISEFMNRRDVVIKPEKKPRSPWDDSDPTTYFRKMREKHSSMREKRLLRQAYHQ